MNKIFFKNKTLVIGDKIPNNNISAKIDFFELKNKENGINTIMKILKNQDLFVYGNPDKVFNYLKSNTNFLNAAGGLVRNANNEILFIYKRDCWDLPKGKIDEGETPEYAAKREVAEECGLKTDDLQISKNLQSVCHFYYEGSDIFLKETEWFEMTYLGKENPEPQEEEDIKMVKWIGSKEISEVLRNTYPSIRELF